MAFAIKAEVSDPRAKAFTFTAQKTMYGGKHIAEGDAVFVFASENEGGSGLIARGVVMSVEAIAKKRGIARQTPRVSVSIRRTALATRPLGRAQTSHRLERRPARNRAQFQVLPPGNEQDRRHLGRSGGIPEHIFPGMMVGSNRPPVTSCGPRCNGGDRRPSSRGFQSQECRSLWHGSAG